MPQVIAKTDGFKFSINGLTTDKTVKGKSYNIPENLFKIWGDDKGGCGYFEREIKSDPVKTPKATKSTKVSKSNDDTKAEAE